MSGGAEWKFESVGKCAARKDRGSRSSATNKPPGGAAAAGKGVLGAIEDELRPKPDGEIGAGAPVPEASESTARSGLSELRNGARHRHRD